MGRRKHLFLSILLGSAWEEGMNWKGMKRIILEYSLILLFGSFNGRNGKLIPLFGSLSVREWNGMEWIGGNTHSFLFP